MGGWGAWFPNMVQTPQNPPKSTENRQISQKPWGGLVGKHIWERSPKKKGFFGRLPLGKSPKNNRIFGRLPLMD